jgi:hypothetical protein
MTVICRLATGTDQTLLGGAARATAARVKDLGGAEERGAGGATGHTSEETK